MVQIINSNNSIEQYVTALSEEISLHWTKKDELNDWH